MNYVSFEIEHYSGDTYFSFMIGIKDDGTIEIVKTDGCSLADVDGDYIFKTDNNLYRMQADDPIPDVTYENILAIYEEHRSRD